MIRPPLFEQFLDIAPGEVLEKVFAFVDEVVEEELLLFLKLEDFLLDGAAGDETIDIDRFGLTHAMRAVDSLVFDARIPPRIEDDDVVGRGQVESGAAGFETDKEDFFVGIGVERFHEFFAVFRLSGKIELIVILIIQCI